MTLLVPGAMALATGAAASIVRESWREDLAPVAAGGAVFRYTDRGREAAPADNVGTLGKRVEGIGE